MRKSISLVTGILGVVTAFAADFPRPLPTDPVQTVATLPAQYPPTWAFLNYASDRIVLRDVGSDARSVKAELQARDSTVLVVPTTRPELYTLDTVWSRFTRGTRTDFISIYDKATFNVIGEIVLPTKRALMTATTGMFTLTDGERMGLVFNFTPSSSVTVVDMVKRKVLGEIEIPGCSLLYATGTRGFSTLCGSGTLLTVRLGADGKVAGRSESEVFNDLDRDPLFTDATSIGRVHYFASMLGHVQPIDLGGDDAKILPAWPLVAPGDAAGGWRPSGWQAVATDGAKTLFVLMQPNANEGTYKDPGSEVWAFDVATHARTQRLRLVRPGSSIALTRTPEPLLLVQAGERLDVYDAKTGSLVRSLGIPGFRTRMTIQPVQ